MTAVILLLTLGGWLIYSALKGQSLAESLTGNTTGTALDPTGGKIPSNDIGGGLITPNTPATSGPHGKYPFRGPHATQLGELTDIGKSKFHLSVSEICRAQNANYGAPDSLHKECRAVDMTGTVANKVAFARYAKSLPWVSEVFCDQAGMSAPGYQHTDHVHVGA